MIITQSNYTEIREGSGARVKYEIKRWYVLGIPVYTTRAELWSKGAKIEDNLRAKIFALDSYDCVYCGTCGARSMLSIDHVIPQIQGGLTIESNLVTACRECNSAKNGRTPEEAGLTPRYGRYQSMTHDDYVQPKDTFFPYNNPL